MHLSIFDFYKSAQAWEVLRLAIRLNFFSAFALIEKTYSLEEISESTKIPKPICSSFLQIFSTIDVIRMVNDQFQLNPTQFSLLHPQSSSYLGHRVEQMEKEISFLRATEPEDLVKNFIEKVSTKDVSDSEIEARHFNFQINDGEFLSASASYSAKEFLDQQEIPDGKVIVDLGGNDGSFLLPLIASRPNLKGTVLDLDRLKSRAETNIRNAGLEARVKFLTQNFFAGEFPTADWYFCGYVFHDWREEVCMYLLRKIHRALPIGGKLVLHENLLDHPIPAVRLSYYLDHFMYQMKRGDGGQYRTSGDYSQMLDTVGFSVERVFYGTEKSFLLAHKR